MLEPLIPTNEKERLESLRSLNILDTVPEERFDRITRIASKLLNVPICQINLVDENRQWFKSCFGISYGEDDRKVSFCAHTILQDDILEIPDARKDKRFADNPKVTGDMHIIFYAGMPISGPDGYNIGTLCLVDNTKSHNLTDEQKQDLRDLAKWAELEINSHQLAKILEDIKVKTDKIQEQNSELEKLNSYMMDREVKISELKERLSKYE